MNLLASGVGGRGLSWESCVCVCGATGVACKRGKNIRRLFFFPHQIKPSAYFNVPFQISFPFSFSVVSSLLNYELMSFFGCTRKHGVEDGF